MYTVTSIYAAIFAMMAIGLANIVSAKRGKANVAILHGGDMNLALWIRRHGNFLENVRLALILMGLAEARGLPVPWLHAMGGVLTMARLSHAAGAVDDAFGRARGSRRIQDIERMVEWQRFECDLGLITVGKHEIVEADRIAYR